MKSHRKGGDEERAVVNTWRERGFEAERVPLSGASGGSYSGDVKLWTARGPMMFECKISAKGKGFKTLYEWLEGVDIVSVRANHKPRLYVLTEDKLAMLLSGLEEHS